MKLVKYAQVSKNIQVNKKKIVYICLKPCSVVEVDLD